MFTRVFLIMETDGFKKHIMIRKRVSKCSQVNLEKVTKSLLLWRFNPRCLSNLFVEQILQIGLFRRFTALSVGAGNVSRTGFLMILCPHSILAVGVGVEVEDSKIVSLLDFYATLHDSFSVHDDRHSLKKKTNKYTKERNKIAWQELATQSLNNFWCYRMHFKRG